MKKDKLNFIDLFAGCGGLSEGFLQTGMYEGLAHVEWETPMVRTLRKRLADRWNHSEEEAEKRVVHFDIQKTKELISGGWDEETKAKYGKTNHEAVSESGLKGLVKDKNVHLVIGGPPCQAYSIAGRAQDKDSMQNDYRNYLFESFIEVVHKFQPDIFVFENVPGMLSACPGGTMVTERIFKSFDDHDYEILDEKLLRSAVQTASDFGVPQKRNRVIIVGIRKKRKNRQGTLKTVYDAINRYKTENTRTVRDAFEDLPEFRPAEQTVRMFGRKISYKLHKEGKRFSGKEDNSYPRFQNERDIGIFRTWVKEDSNNIFTSEQRIEFYNKLMGKKSNHGKYRNLEWDKPSPTVVAHLYKDGLMFIHPDANQARSISVREAAILQSFPDDFDFPESMGNNYKMIGNAVPPLMANKIACAIAEVFHLLTDDKAVQVKSEETLA